MLFKNAPSVIYNYTDSLADPEFLLIKNLWRRNEILEKYLTSLTLFDEYIIKSGETPETISFNQYEDPFFGWTILVVNDITNFHADWPKSQTSLLDYVNNKYENPDATKHYETTRVVDALGRQIVPAGILVPSNYQITYYDGTASAGVTVNPVTPVTYYQYEAKLNEEKEKIRLIRPSYVREFAEQYVKTLKDAGLYSIGYEIQNVKME